MTDAIATGLQQVNDRIQQACNQVGRDKSTLRLLAASKRTDDRGVAKAVSLGHGLFGENRAQSLRDKYDATIESCPEAEWHFIGHLQKNKIKYVVGRATMIHTIDSLSLAEAISSRVLSTASSPMEVLIQVKYGTESSKTGTDRDTALALARQVDALEGLKLSGLMTIPPITSDPADCFHDLSQLAQTGRNDGLNLRELSMGMSGDLEAAVAAGSTIVRIGTAIFNPRG